MRIGQVWETGAGALERGCDAVLERHPPQCAAGPPARARGRSRSWLALIGHRPAYTIDRFRMVHQDCAFGIRPLVDMALRALSPGINDTTTAVMCVDYLTGILSRLASREIPSSLRREDGELRVLTN